MLPRQILFQVGHNIVELGEFGQVIGKLVANLRNSFLKPTELSVLASHVVSYHKV